MDQITKNPTTLLVVFGEGGHKTEMTQLLSYLAKQSINVISIGPDKLTLPPQCHYIAHFSVADIRHKTSRWRTLIAIIPVMFKLFVHALLVWRKFPLSGVVSTGPGLCVIPMLVLRLLGVKTVFIETYCRFHSRSMTGRVMSRVAHRFLVQNKEQLALYPHAEYCGRL